MSIWPLGQDFGLVEFVNKFLGKVCLNAKLLHFGRKTILFFLEVDWFNWDLRKVKECGQNIVFKNLRERFLISGKYEKVGD